MEERQRNAKTENAEEEIRQIGNERNRRTNCRNFGLRFVFRRFRKLSFDPTGIGRRLCRGEIHQVINF